MVCDEWNMYENVRYLGGGAQTMVGCTVSTTFTFTFGLFSQSLKMHGISWNRHVFACFWYFWMIKIDQAPRMLGQQKPATHSNPGCTSSSSSTWKWPSRRGQRSVLRFFLCPAWDILRCIELYWDILGYCELLWWFVNVCNIFWWFW